MALEGWGKFCLRRAGPGRRRPNWPEAGKKAPHRRLLAVGALLGCKEVALVQGRARGLLFIGVEVGTRGGRG